MFTPFEDLRITTQTYVVYSNLVIPMEEFYAAIEYVPLVQPYKKKMDLEQENLRDGDIIYAQHGDVSKGVKKTFKRKQKLNVLTIITKYQGKLYNVKIPNSGKIQFTGCRGTDVVIFVMKLIIQLLKKHGLFQNDGEVLCYSVCVMSNLNITIPYRVDRNKIHNFINQKTEHISIFEISVGYVGVNIKILSNVESREEATIDKFIFGSDGVHSATKVRYREFLDDYENIYKKPIKKSKKEMYNSFLVFESGMTIMSGCCSFENRKDAYNSFMNIVTNYRKEICLTE